MVKIKLDVTRIPREKIFVGQKGKYVDLILFENRDGPDQYGNDGFVAIDTTKEEREAGEKGAIVGNFKNLGGSKKPASVPQRTQSQGRRPASPPPRPPADPELEPSEDDISFGG